MPNHSFIADVLSWSFTILSVAGTYLNSCQDRRCFYFWLVANTGFLTLFCLEGMPAQATLFSIFVAFNIIALNKWEK